MKQGVTPIGVAFLFWSDGNEKRKGQLKREAEAHEKILFPKAYVGIPFFYTKITTV